jgi:hypothetical protein
VHRLKRLHRFLKNEAIPLYAASQVMACMMWRYRPGGQRRTLVPIALDWTKVRQFHVLWAAMPRRKRTLPLAPRRLPFRPPASQPEHAGTRALRAGRQLVTRRAETPLPRRPWLWTHGVRALAAAVSLCFCRAP